MPYAYLSPGIRRANNTIIAQKVNTVYSAVNKYKTNYSYYVLSQSLNLLQSLSLQ